MKRIHVGRNYNSDDMTQTGYDLYIMKQRTGFYRVLAIYESRWSGSRTNAEYLEPYKYHTVEDAIDSAETMLEDEELEYEIMGKWECRNNGYVVQ